ncbi:MAG: hydrogenase maturation protease [Phycisphaerales bacterium]
MQQAEHLIVGGTSTRAAVLVLGIGNILLRDEGVGVHVVRAMENSPLPDDVELLDGGAGGADLLDAISERRRLIVVDALDADVPPGTILKMTPEDLAALSSSVSLHEFGIAETLMAARRLKCEPHDVTIIAIRPWDTRCGLELSDDMQRRLPRVIDIVLGAVGRRGGESQGRSVGIS